MKSEICPPGTESLLSHLGYHLNPQRTAWCRERSDAPVQAMTSGPDRLGRVAAARMSEIVPEIGLSPNSGDRVMSVDQIKYRRTQACLMRQFGEETRFQRRV